MAQLPNPALTPDTVQVGWAKVNITPTHPAPLAGYGKRKGKRLTGIHDSVYVRAFVFKNQTERVALISLDLLIAPMSVTAALKEHLPKTGFQKEQVVTNFAGVLRDGFRKTAGRLAHPTGLEEAGDTCAVRSLVCNSVECWPVLARPFRCSSR